MSRRHSPRVSWQVWWNDGECERGGGGGCQKERLVLWSRTGRWMWRCRRAVKDSGQGKQRGLWSCIRDHRIRLWRCNICPVALTLTPHTVKAPRVWFCCHNRSTYLELPFRVGALLCFFGCRRIDQLPLLFVFSLCCWRASIVCVWLILFSANRKLWGV